jgi:predicted nuclease of predicted toxin-antitoxin system
VKLLLDQGLPRRSAQLLRDAGLDAVHASDVGLSRADDESILVWCREQGRIVVTLDADFHARLAVSGARGPSVIRIRQQGLKGPAAASLIQTVANRHQQALEAGAMLTVVSGRVRRHALPVARRQGERPAR